MAKYKVGDKVTIKGNHSGHGFAVGTEVYLLGQENTDYMSDVWLASENPSATVAWTGRYRTLDRPVVMNVEEADMEPIAPQWTELEVDDTVTIKYLPTEQEFTTKVHEGQYSDLNVLGWEFNAEYDPAFEDVVLLSVEKASKPEPEPFKLPTTLGSQIELTFTAGDSGYTPEVRHCVLVNKGDDRRWLVLSQDGEYQTGYHTPAGIEAGLKGSVVSDKLPMYKVEVLFEAEADD